MFGFILKKGGKHNHQTITTGLSLHLSVGNTAQVRDIGFLDTLQSVEKFKFIPWLNDPG